MNNQSPPSKSLLHNNAIELFKTRYQNECNRVNRFMVWLMIGQWIAGIGFALFFSPYTWIGETYQIHVHVWAAVLLGGAISGLPICWVRLFPNEAHSRHVMAISQMLWSALLIHLSGGRIETHFHVFASLAILSIYRDWKLLITATVVVALDHFVRGVFYPLSAFGIVTESPYRWMEHAAWVIFEVSFLAPGCVMLRNEIMELCVRQTEIEQAKKTVDQQVEQRTADLARANLELEASIAETKRLALVARYTDNVVIITDDQARIEWVNEGFVRVTGYQPAEAMGKTPLELLNGPDTDTNQISEIQHAIKSKHGYDLEMLRYRKNGEPFWMSIEARPIKDASGFILVESDITSRVNAELEKQRLSEQLIEASRAAGIAEVATGVLHNVGNVLNSVNVSASLIEKQMRKSALERLEKVSDLIMANAKDFGAFVDTDDRGKKIPTYLSRITDALKEERSRISDEFADLLNNVEHIKEIVAVQQDVAKSKGLQQSLTPRRVIDDAITANKSELTNNKVTVTKGITDDSLEFISDKRKVLQILINLIRNSLQALVEAEIYDPQIEITVRSEDDLILFDVADNGIGIAAENLTRIFGHGFTTKKTGKGFGLHSCANAATELGGALTGHSEGIGLGSVFTLTLPLVADDGEIASKANVATHASFDGYAAPQIETK